jgi:hypothetical protein
MTARLSEDKRRAILDDIRAAQLGCNAIAKKHHVSPSVVSVLARDHGLTFDRRERSRAKTRAATEAHKFDAKAARSAMLEKLHGDAELLRQRAWQPYTTVIGSGDTARFVTMKLPPLRDQREAYVALAICLEKALLLEQHDDTSGLAAAKTMINDLMGAFKLAHYQRVAEESGDVDPSASTDNTGSP